MIILRFTSAMCWSYPTDFRTHLNERSHVHTYTHTHTHPRANAQADRQRLGDLELELSATRERMEGYDKEFSKLKNQEVTVRRLEEENRQLVAKV